MEWIKKKNYILTILTLVVYMILLSWAIIFKCNAIDSDLRFGPRILVLIPFKMLIKQISINELLIEVLLNIVAFMPLGILYSHLDNKSNLLKAIIVGMVVSLMYEVTQYIIALGTSDITDIIMNTTGSLLGYIIYRNTFAKMKEKTNNIVMITCIIVGSIVSVYGIINTINSFDQYMEFINNGIYPM